MQDGKHSFSTGLADDVASNKDQCHDLYHSIHWGGRWVRLRIRIRESLVPTAMINIAYVRSFVAQDMLSVTMCHILSKQETDRTGS